MQLYKIQQLIELLKEYNDYFFAGNDRPCIDLIEDANQHKTSIINTFINEHKTDYTNEDGELLSENKISVNDFKDFVDEELN